MNNMINWLNIDILDWGFDDVQMDRQSDNF